MPSPVSNARESRHGIKRLRPPLRVGRQAAFSSAPPTVAPRSEEAEASLPAPAPLELCPDLLAEGPPDRTAALFPKPPRPRQASPTDACRPTARRRPVDWRQQAAPLPRWPKGAPDDGS